MYNDHQRCLQECRAAAQELQGQLEAAQRQADDMQVGRHMDAPVNCLWQQVEWPWITIRAAPLRLGYQPGHPTAACGKGQAAISLLQRLLYIWELSGTALAEFSTLSCWHSTVCGTRQPAARTRSTADLNGCGACSLAGTQQL